MAMPTRCANCGKLELFSCFDTQCVCVCAFFFYHCLMSLHGFSWPFYCSFALSVHLNNYYVADRNKSLCYSSNVSQRTFCLSEQSRIFYGFVAIQQPTESFQRDIKPCENKLQRFFFVGVRCCIFTCKHECFTVTTIECSFSCYFTMIAIKFTEFRLTEWGIFTCTNQKTKIQITFRQELFVLPFIADISLSIFILLLINFRLNFYSFERKKFQLIEFIAYWKIDNTARIRYVQFLCIALFAGWTEKHCTAIWCSLLQVIRYLASSHI